MFSRKKYKSQAALEFLTTYAWAFLVILITIGALYYFGIFDFGKFLPQECSFTSQFQCIDFTFIGDEIRLKLLNNIGERIMVTSFDVTNDVVDTLSCVNPALPFDWAVGTEADFVFTGCQGGAFIVTERTEAKINFVYYAVDTSSQPRHSVSGKISAVVNEP
ncbi:hypothetical protein ISS07_03740 [Candidatus Woesearchaeota archaeon]|nr:hypothetical protein [Candidatus Woesearchaeota archaeon]